MLLVLGIENFAHYIAVDSSSITNKVISAVSVYFSAVIIFLQMG